MYILGISCFYHDSAAALLKNGQLIVASAEERFSRKKHDTSFPKQAIAFCLQQAGIQAKDIAYVVFYEKPFVKFERNLITSLENFPHSLSFFVDSMRNFLAEKLWIKSDIQLLGIDSTKILFVPHHLSHAAASFYPSPFSKAAYVTFDGAGEWTTTSWGIGEENKLLPKEEIRFPDSIGLLYATFTSFLGFPINDGEYTVMGMASFGKPKYQKKIQKLYTLKNDGSFVLHKKYFSFNKNATKMHSDIFEAEFSACNKFDLAASLQACTEEIIFTLLHYVQAQTNTENLCLGGGVALNSVVNGKIRARTRFKNIFIFPASGDDGAAAGAALYVYHHILGNTKRKNIDNMFLGKAFSQKDIESFLQSKQISFTKIPDKKLLPFLAKQLSLGKVVGYIEGRAEYGPRALGHRSILADPRKKQMKDIVNKKIKFREEFRPFAPAVLQEDVKKYFFGDDRLLYPYMLSVCKTTTNASKEIPAVLHVDKTARIQTVNKTYKGKFYKLLKEFKKQTGIGVLLNTSFNLKGEPIVNSPQDAYNTFLKSGIDILVLENCVLQK